MVQVRACGGAGGAANTCARREPQHARLWAQCPHARSTGCFPQTIPCGKTPAVCGLSAWLDRCLVAPPCPLQEMQPAHYLLPQAGMAPAVRGLTCLSGPLPGAPPCPLQEIQRMHKTGRPVLVGTTSVEKSEQLAGMLDALSIPYEVRAGLPRWPSGAV